MTSIRKLQIVKDHMQKATEAFQEILENMGIQVIDIKRDGENFEFTFDRDLAEEPGKLTAIKAILKGKFPEHEIIEVKESA